MKPPGSSVFTASLVVVVAIFCYCCHAIESRTDPLNSQLQKQPAKLDPSCGNSDELPRKVSICARPLMNLLSGSIEKWPRTEEDAMKLCDSYAWSERCIRDSSRKCAKGIQKTILSILAQSISRVRKRECNRSKAAAIVKTTMCLEQQQNSLHPWMANVTSRLTVIEKEMTGSVQINGVCCVINDIERELKAILNPICEEEGKWVLRMYRAVLEDVIDLICTRPKCNNYLKEHKIPKANEFDDLVAIILRIVFSFDRS